MAKYKNMEKRATTAVDSHQATENQALLVSKHPAKCRYSNTKEKETQFLKTPLGQKKELSYAFPT